MISKTEIKNNSSPKSLRDIVLDVIAKDPSLSLSIIQDEKIWIPHLKEELLKSTPFMELLPLDLKYEIVLRLPLKDWEALYTVSKEWKLLVTRAANAYLDTNKIMEKLKPIQSYDFNLAIQNLMTQVNLYHQQTGSRAVEVRLLNQLGQQVMCSLTSPWAKLVYLQKKIDEVQNSIKNEYGNYGNGFFSSGPKTSLLFNILNQFRPPYSSIVKSPWVKEALSYTRFTPQHPVSKFFLEATIELSKLKEPYEEAKTENQFTRSLN
ncbi:hypothetical protein [Legionella waltersii]|uniref:F-box domain-containing protein n=1 Tax=Legionella waltersii TaxID=66969 RepID=A0A0W1AMA2_9GAMM|nr:hypothetical protein [Legionella waltersii]KTD82485.1 hypothetical protein Lwal_0962 [Legionella waltersii]SNV07085.1 Uncharacterised protein [Legionella waltersii]